MGTFVPSVKLYMGTNVDIGRRLKEERERLKYNQSDFAAIAGASRKTLFNYESGERTPDALYLSAWAKVGLDVMYVVTGERTQTIVTQGFDRRKMAEAIQGVEFILKETRRMPTPEKKAEIVLAVYDMLLNDEKKTQESILRLVKSAA